MKSSSVMNVVIQVPALAREIKTTRDHSLFHTGKKVSHRKNAEDCSISILDR